MVLIVLEIVGFVVPGLRKSRSLPRKLAWLHLRLNSCVFGLLPALATTHASGCSCLVSSAQPHISCGFMGAEA